MNFQNLPKSLLNYDSISPSFSSQVSIPFVNSSYFYNLLPLLDQIKHLVEEDKKNEELLTLINPFILVFLPYYGKLVKPPISKIKIEENIIFCFQEIFASLNVWKSHKHFFYFGEYTSGFETFTLHYKNKYHLPSREIPNVKMVCYDIKKDILQDNQKYSKELLFILQNICETFQKSDSCVVVLDHLFLKPIVESIFILSSLFAKTFLVKPSISNQTTFEKFLVCQNFQLSGMKIENLKIKINEIVANIVANEAVSVSSILSCELPVFFKNKVEDINVVFGQSQIDILHQIINIASSKNKNEKMDNLQKHGIQKSSQWCDKFDVPYNKYTERPNIFRDDRFQFTSSEENQILVPQEIIAAAAAAAASCDVFTVEQTNENERAEAV
jgi:hypothetical protein